MIDISAASLQFRGAPVTLMSEGVEALLRDCGADLEATLPGSKRENKPGAVNGASRQGKIPHTRGPTTQRDDSMAGRFRSCAGAPVSAPHATCTHPAP